MATAAQNLPPPPPVGEQLVDTNGLPTSSLTNWLVILRAVINTVRGESTGNSFANLPNYADDAAALAGGLPIGGFYRTVSTIKIRVA